jgi:hypothetical protein
MEDAGGDEESARRQYMLACLRSFTRQYIVQVRPRQYMLARRGAPTRELL